MMQKYQNLNPGRWADQSNCAVVIPYPIVEDR